MAKDKGFSGFNEMTDMFLPISEGGNDTIIDPEEIERQMAKLDDIDDSLTQSKDEPIKPESKTPEKQSKPVIKTTVELDEEDIEDKVLKTIDSKLSKSDTEQAQEVDETVEVEYEEADLVDAFADIFVEELDWKFDEGEKPKSIKELVEYMQNVIEENSTPDYANDDIKALDEFVKQGGDLADYYKKVYTSEVNIDTVDLTKESNQKAVIKESLRNKGYSEQRIDKLISRYETSDSLEEEAQDSLEEVKEFREKTKTQLLETQKKQAAVELKQQQDFISSVQKIIDEAKEVRGFELSKKEKQELIDYIFKPEKDGMTRYQKEYNNDLRNLVESAFFTMKGKDFEQQLEKKATTEAIKKLKLKLKTKGKSTKNAESDQEDSNSKIPNLWEVAGRELRKF
jgi:hypothetical protein